MTIERLVQLYLWHNCWRSVVDR